MDGASDDHEEVQFWWTAHHIETLKHVTLVTTRSSGSESGRTPEWMFKPSSCKHIHPFYSCRFMSRLSSWLCKLQQTVWEFGACSRCDSTCEKGPLP